MAKERKKNDVILDFRNRHLAVYRFMERNDGFRTLQAQWLQLIVYDTQHVMVVPRVDLDEHVITAGGVMTFHHFGNLP